MLITGNVETKLLQTFKRVEGYEPEDVKLLVWLISQFSSVITTSYALAEASNLAGELSGYKRQRWFEALAQFTRITAEAHVPTAVVADHDLLVPFGVTDAALGLIAKDHVLLTAENRLSGRLASNGNFVLNFNNLRLLWMLP